MNESRILLAVVVMFLLVVLFQSYQLGVLEAKFAAKSGKQAGLVSTSAQQNVQKSTQPSSSGMVGGC